MEKIMTETPQIPDTSASSIVSAAPAHPDMRWYVVHAYSGMEKAVERNIVERIQRAGMQSKFGRFLVPTEEVVEMKNGQRKTTERRFFPGYVLVEMIMDDESWHLVKHTNKVTGFVGGAKPSISHFRTRCDQNCESNARGNREASPQSRIHGWRVCSRQRWSIHRFQWNS